MEVVLLSKGQEMRALAKKGPSGYIVGEFPHGTQVTEFPNLYLDVKRGTDVSKPCVQSDDDDGDDDPKAVAKVREKPNKSHHVLRRPAGNSKQASQTQTK